MLKKWIIRMLFIPAIILLMMANPVFADANTSFALDLDTGSIQAGQQVIVKVIGQNLKDMYAYEATFAYDSDKLKLVKAESAVQGFMVPAKETGGTLKVAATMTGKKSGITGSSTLCTLTFEGISGGTAQIRLQAVKLIDSELGVSTFTMDTCHEVEIEEKATLHQIPVGSPDSSSAVATLSLEDMKKLLGDAVADSDGIRTIVLVMDEIKGIHEYFEKLPSELVTRTKLDLRIIIRTPMGTLTLPGNMFTSNELNGKEYVYLGIRVDMPGSLSGEARTLIGKRPVITLKAKTDGGPLNWDKPGVYTTIPYTPEPGEGPASIIIYGIDTQGRLQIVSNSSYDSNTGSVKFVTSRFSRYAVGYNKVSFKDVSAGAWYAKAVEFAAARGITSGTGTGNFSPANPLTRGQFLFMVMRAFDMVPDSNPQDNFADAGNTYYTGYLAAAKRLGIAAGIGGNRYAPEQGISRQEMCALLYRTLKIIGFLPKGISVGKDLSDYSDRTLIAQWAQDAMDLFIEKGIISGDNVKINPLGAVTRAQMVQVLYKLIMK